MRSSCRSVQLHEYMYRSTRLLGSGVDESSEVDHLSMMRVAIIGAGVSGVVAAAHAQEAGLDVTVFERNTAAGGVW